MASRVENRKSRVEEAESGSLSGMPKGKGSPHINPMERGLWEKPRAPWSGDLVAT